MKIKEGFIMQKLADSTVVVAVGKASKGFNGIIRLNDTGEFLWKKLESETTEAELTQALLLEYDVTAEKAGEDVRSFTAKLREADILE